VKDYGLVREEDLHTSQLGGIRMFHCVALSRNVIVLKRRGSEPTIPGYS